MVNWSFKRILKIDSSNAKRYKIYFLGIKIFSLRRKLNLSQSEYIKLEAIKNSFPEILSMDEMLKKIKDGASLARFGDAEFDIMLGCNKEDPYQKPSSELTKRLSSILVRQTSENLIVAIPPFNDKHNNIKNFYKDISFWPWYWLNRWSVLQKYFIHKRYGNSFFSRDAVFYELTIEDLKSIWGGRNVIFVVPENRRFFYDERLFGNIKSRSEIVVPPTSAFVEYERILSECLSCSKDSLFFICAGPTATVLAVELSDNGYQALDMGHFPNCYLEFLGEAKRPEVYPMTKSVK